MILLKIIIVNIVSKTQNHIHIYFGLCLWQTVIEKIGLEELEHVEWKDIHVGITGRDLKTKLCNTVIFVIKYIIFRSRSEGTLPTHRDIFQRIVEYRNEENAIAMRRHKLEKHLLKWESIESYLTPLI